MTSIDNFVLASDYVQTQTDLACTEAANEAARVAVNSLLDKAGWQGDRCRLWAMPMPSEVALWRRHDQARFNAGKPWDGRLLY